MYGYRSYSRVSVHVIATGFVPCDLDTWSSLVDAEHSRATANGAGLDCVTSIVSRFGIYPMVVALGSVDAFSSDVTEYDTEYPVHQSTEAFTLPVAHLFTIHEEFGIIEARPLHFAAYTDFDVGVVQPVTVLVAMRGVLYVDSDAVVGLH